MNILLMEDNPAKKNRLLARLKQEAGESGRVDAALCSEDAKRLLSERQYDLLVADLLIPRNLGDTEHDANAIELFESIDEGLDGIIRPLYSLTISAGEGLSAEASDFFHGRPWGVISYSEGDDECLRTIEKICEFVKSEIRSTQRVNRSCDVAIICALMEPEFSAIEKLNFSWQEFEPLDATQLIKYGSFQADGRLIKVAAAFCPMMGPVPTAVLTSKIMQKLHPKLLLMSGICAGIPQKAAIGDVVAADVSWDWQSGKYVDRNGAEAFEIAPHQIPIDGVLRNQVLMLKRDREFWDSLSKLAIKQKVEIPKLVLGPMASGSSVLADERVISRIKSAQHKNVVGLDMEVYAMYAAAEASKPGMKCLAFKAVCDNGDKQKNDEHQLYAAEISAAAIYHFLTFHAGPVLAAH